MSFSLSSKRWLGMALAVALGLVSAYADGKGEKIQFSGPGGNTNHVHSKPGEKIKFSGPEDNADSGVMDGANRFNPQPSAFRQAQEAILAPFVNMMQQPTDSMEGVLAVPQPQPQNAQTSERARRLLDKRQNWAFSDYNDLNGTAAGPLDGSHSGSAGSEDKSVSLIERYYQRLGRQQPNANANTRTLKDAFDSAKEYATHDEEWDPSTGSYMTDKKFLKQLSTFGVNAHKNKGSGGDDNAPTVNLFGDSVVSDQNALVEAQQRRDDFQKILNPNYVPAPIKSSLNPIYSEQFAPPASLATTSTAATTTPVRRNPLNTYNAALADPTSVALHSPVYDNPTDTALGMPTPAPVRPQVQPMTLEKMQSMIDPTAVFKKHNF